MKITKWVLSSESLRLQITVEDDLGLTSQVWNRHANQLWTKPEQPRERALPKEKALVLDHLVMEDSVLGSGNIPVYLGLRADPEAQGD